MPEPDLKPRLCHLPMGRRISEDLQYTIEHWATDAEGDALVRQMETLGRLSNLMVARATFAEAVRQRPGARILLLQASRVVMDDGRYGINATAQSGAKTVKMSSAIKRAKAAAKLPITTRSNLASRDACSGMHASRFKPRHRIA